MEKKMSWVEQTDTSHPFCQKCFNMYRKHTAVRALVRTFWIYFISNFSRY